MSLALGRVAAVHPNDHSVDVVMVADGARLSGVQVMVPFATTSSGEHDLPDVDAPASGDPWSLTERTGKDMIAVVGYVGRSPIVVGFLFPQVSQMLFGANRRMMRHTSDVYQTIDGGGETELYHPSGTFVRIGVSPDHEDLTGKDVDGNFAITKNTDKAPHLRVVLAAGGAKKADLHVYPNGDIFLEHDGNLTAHTKGNAAVTVDGSTTVTSTGAAVWNVPAGLTVNGDVATLGALTNNGVNVGSTHTHAGVIAGPSRTGLPG